MNVYTRGEKIDMFIEDVIDKIKKAVEITVIVGGIIALVAIGFMSKRITELETELKEYEMMQMEETQQESGDDWIVIRDSVTGEVIYSGWR